MVIRPQLNPNMKLLSVISSLVGPGIQGVLPHCLEKLWGWIFMIILLASTFLCFILGIKTSDKVCNLALPALSILTALVFSIIFTVPAQLEQRLKAYEKIDDEPTVNYLIRYRNFVQKFSRQLISICVSCIVIIVCIIPQSFVSLVTASILTGITIPFTIELILLFAATTVNLSKLIQESISFSTELIQKKKQHIKKENNDN